MSAIDLTSAQGLGDWLPKDRSIISSWVADQLQKAKETKDEALRPSIQNFSDVVHASSSLLNLANKMFSDVPNRPKYRTDPVGHRALKNFDELIITMNSIIVQGPQFYDVKEPKTAMGLIGFPINALLDWPMATESGYSFFREYPEVNEAIKGVLNDWKEYLGCEDPPNSQKPLDGWLSDTGKKLLASVGNNNVTTATFEQMFVCPDPSDKKYLGYRSWDHFFTRDFQDWFRPLAAPDDDKTNIKFPEPTLVIVNSCESAPLQWAQNVKWSDEFWLKAQPYSLSNMLNDNPLAKSFMGGSVYQAFLSAKSYHCWHAPVSGTVKQIEFVNGTYYSENMYEGFAGDYDDPDPAAPNYSQPYISAVATRGIIYIDADDPRIGLMAIVYIGMAEVSSCEFVVSKEDHVKKGDKIGRFHFGGSSHCMVFQPGVNLQFVNPPENWNMDTEPNQAVKSALGVVVPPYRS